MTEIIAVFFGACLVNNLILSGMLGIAPAMSTAKRIEVALGMSLAMIFILTITAAVSHLVDRYVLIPLDASWLQLITFIISIALGIVLALKILKRFKPALSQQMTLFLPLALMNTAVLGLALMNAQYEYGLFLSLLFGLSAAAGFGLVLILISAMQERMDVANIPAPFKGTAIMLITLGILSMAFMGFAGMGVQ